MDSHYNLILNVIESDSDNATRPVSLEVNTPEEIDGNINPTITYGKVGDFKLYLEASPVNPTLREYRIHGLAQ
jgi:hypothetical protein